MFYENPAQTSTYNQYEVALVLQAVVVRVLQCTYRGLGQQEAVQGCAGLCILSSACQAYASPRSSSPGLSCTNLLLVATRLILEEALAIFLRRSWDKLQAFIPAVLLRPLPEATELELQERPTSSHQAIPPGT